MLHSKLNLPLITLVELLLTAHLDTGSTANKYRVDQAPAC